MGQSFRKPAFTEDQLYEYQDCTYFTRNEILRLYRRFCSLRPGTIDSRAADISTRLSFLDVQAMPELRHNPFKERLCEVFSTDGEGLNFEDFLDMFSVLSDHAPWELKAAYAFRIYDFNNDNVICTDDIKLTLRTLTGDRLAEEKQEEITNCVMAESDVINDGKLTFSEFEHVVVRSPDFVNLFHVTI